MDVLFFVLVSVLVYVVLTSAIFWAGLGLGLLALAYALIPEVRTLMVMLLFFCILLIVT